MSGLAGLELSGALEMLFMQVVSRLHEGQERINFPLKKGDAGS